MERPSEILLQEIRSEFPDFQLVYKRSSRLNRLLHWAFVVITLGRQREFLATFYNVIGYTLFVPDGWDDLAELDRVVVLRHERVHLRQRKRFGSVGLAFLYLIPLLPIGLAYGRARLEWEAYSETLRAKAELIGIDAARSTILRTRIVSQFTGPAYGWMWPFRRQVERWYDEVVAELEAGGPQGSAPGGGSASTERSI
jgi:hypothetical protein